MRLNDVAETVVISSSNKAMLGGAGAGLVSIFSHVNWLGVIGVLVAIAGYFTNMYFHIRRDHRERKESEARNAREAKESEARIKALKDGCGL